MNNKKILVVAAHPDDEVLGCGGTICGLTKEPANQVYVLILGEGATSRDGHRKKSLRSNELRELENAADRASKIMGVRKVFFGGLADNRFDEKSLLDIVKIVEKNKQAIDPNIIFTHYANDLNIDHRITFQAVITAARPQPKEKVREIYSFEILSSTEWNYPVTFSPNYFVDITSDIAKKQLAMAEYAFELRQFPHPRSLEGIKINAQAWGMKTGTKYAEAFEVVRIIK